MKRERMEIFFETEKLARLCDSRRALDRAYGEACAKRIRQRLQELEAVESLADMVFGRPHELKAGRAGQVSVDLVHPLRLIFRPTAQPPPTKTDGGLDRLKVKSVTIIEVTDPH
jgi:plasmid maintenance system killer protein